MNEADVVGRIDAAVAAFGIGDVDGALLALIEVWREVRAVELAEAIDRVAGARTGDGKKLGPKTWMAMAARRDSKELDRLLATPLPKPIPASLDALYEWDDDPRIARVLTRFVGEHSVKLDGGGRALESRALGRLARLRDVRVLPALRAMRHVHSDVERSLRLTIATLDKHAVTLPGAAIAALATLTTTDAHETSLLAAIAAAIDDRAAYEVYADWLAERSDPRGELLALQLRESADARRIDALIAHHGERWAGAIGARFKKPTWRFERGLFAGGELVDGAEVAPTEPAWSFVRAIRTRVYDVAMQRAGARLVNALPAVRELGVVSPAIANELASASLRELWIGNADEEQQRGDWFRANGQEAPQADIDPRLAELAGLPALERLVVYSRMTREFAATAPVIARLTSLVLRRAEGDVLAALAARDDARKLRAVTVEVLSQLTLARDADGGPFTRATAHLTDARDIERIATAIARVPVGWLRSIVVTGDVAFKPYNRREFQMFDAAIAQLAPRPAIEVCWEFTGDSPGLQER